jgi:hypothetical protein
MALVSKSQIAEYLKISMQTLRTRLRPHIHEFDIEFKTKKILDITEATRIFVIFGYSEDDAKDMVHRAGRSKA